MKGHLALGEVTGVMGDALTALRSEGVDLDERTVRLLTDRFCDIWKATHQPVDFLSLIKAVDNDEINHGGLLSRETLQIANELRLKL